MIVRGKAVVKESTGIRANGVSHERVQIQTATFYNDDPNKLGSHHLSPGNTLECTFGKAHSDVLSFAPGSEVYIDIISKDEADKNRVEADAMVAELEELRDYKATMQDRVRASRRILIEAMGHTEGSLVSPEGYTIDHLATIAKVAFESRTEQLKGAIEKAQIEQSANFASQERDANVRAILARALGLDPKSAFVQVRETATLAESVASLLIGNPSMMVRSVSASVGVTQDAPDTPAVDAVGEECGCAYAPAEGLGESLLAAVDLGEIVQDADTLRVKPGDILLIGIDSKVSVMRSDALKATLEQLLPQCKVILSECLEPGFTILRPDLRPGSRVG